jgi:hypothetical protein
MANCLHLEVDDGSGCGVNVTEIKEPAPNVGNIGGIVKLINATVKTYTQLVRENTDPKNPSLPRLRLIGGQFVRIPHKNIYNDLIGPSYIAARALGYRGGIGRWADLVRENISL